VAFGLFSGSTSGLRTGVLLGTGLLAVVLVLIYGWRHSPREAILQTGLALVLGGALGNLIDRAAYGHVVDFLYFNAGEYYWPAFNIADSAITVGVACMVIVLVRDEIRSRS
jgi:signal peptidase II